MHATSFVFAAGALILPSVFAASQASVKNNCNYGIYIQSVTNNGGPVGPVVSVAAGGSYSEAFQSAGAAIKIGVHPQFYAPLTFEYTPSGNTVYYDLSNNAGNPFVGAYNDLFPSDTTCPKFDCAPNDSNCYSNGQSIKVKACGVATNLGVTVCAAS